MNNILIACVLLTVVTGCAGVVEDFDGAIGGYCNGLGGVVGSDICMRRAIVKGVPGDQAAQVALRRQQERGDGDLKLNAYGPGVHMDQYGRAVTLRPGWGNDDTGNLRIEQDAYGPGVHMDQYGRPVYSQPRY
jgi:hypothetical protein